MDQAETEAGILEVVSDLHRKLLDGTIENIRSKMKKRGVSFTYAGMQDFLRQMGNDDKIDVQFQIGETHRNKYLPKNRNRLFDIEEKPEAARNA